LDGIITGRDVLRHSHTIWREFGLTCLVRCLWACARGKKRTTFLAIAFHHHEHTHE
jgi:hypothetical protein